MDKEFLKQKFRHYFSIPILERFFVYSFFVISFLGGISLGFLNYKVTVKSDDLDKLATFQPAMPTRLYDSKGRLISELFRHQRKLVTLDDIPRPVIAAFLAIEDTNFYDHFGIDFKGILRAAWTNLKSFKIVQGGSTITQQLVKGLYTESERTLYRKIYEAVLALQAEKKFTKDQILEMYFNQTYFGHGAYGIQSAAQFYFDKPLNNLNFMEASILAALPKAPHNYSPFRSPHEARSKNKVALNRLVDLGYLKKEEADKLYETFWPEYWKKIVTTPPSKTIFGEKTDKAPYFTEYVRVELEALYGSEGEDNLYSKGLQVYTTLDLDQQKFAEDALLAKLKIIDPMAKAYNANSRGGVDGGLLSVYYGLRNILSLPGISSTYSLRNDFRQKFKNEISDAFELLSLVLPASEVNEVSVEFLGANREFRNDLNAQGAFIAMENKTGRLSAMIGGRDYRASQFNRATQAKRQPGSAFKPFVYGAALEDRVIHYAMGFLDSPIINIQPDGSMWQPANYEGGFRGYVHAHKALASSLNLVSVQIYDLVGPDQIINFASRLMKIPESRFQPNPALALGASEVTPMEMMLGFSIIGNKGQDIIPHAIIYITDRDGNIIHSPEEEVIQVLNHKKRTGQIQVIEEGIAFIVRKMMENVVLAGTPTASIRDAGFTGIGAGKTGTTSSWNDVWFGGFTTDLSAVVWMGMDNGSMTLGKGVSGGEFSAPVWGEFMAKTYKVRGKNPEPFDQKVPKGVHTSGVCAFTGKWMNSQCEDEKGVGTYVPSPITKNGKRRTVGGERCDCQHVKQKGFLDILQEQQGIENEEINKKNKRAHEMMDGDKLQKKLNKLNDEPAPLP